MQLSAELVKDTLIVKKPRDAGLLHSKSRFGTPLSGNRLQLDILEGLFLVGEGKLTVYQNKKIIDFSLLLEIATQKISDFEIKYLAYRDLRKRGHSIQRFPKSGKIHFYLEKQQGSTQLTQRFITTFSERDLFTIEEIKQLITAVEQKNGVLWFVLVDEEGDLTYYEVSKVDLQGEMNKYTFSQGLGLLLHHRVVVFDPLLSKQLLQKEFFGKPFGEGLQLSLVEALYLVERGVLEIQLLDKRKKLTEKDFRKLILQQQPDIDTRLLVFTDLKKRGLIVKTGFKFGAHFRAYTKDPDHTHAEYLVHVVPQGFEGIWAEISRAVRLAHSVNKEIIFANVDGTTIDFIRLGRLRP